MADYQRESFFSDLRSMFIPASTKSGKTTAGMYWADDLAWRIGSKEKIWWLSPSIKQSRIPFERSQAMPHMQGLGLTWKQSPFMRIEYPHGAEIDFHTGDNVDKLYGDEVSGIIIDECSRVKPEVYALVRSVTHPKAAPIRYIGNIVTEDEFWRKCEEARLGQLPNTGYKKITCDDAVAAGIMDPNTLEEDRQSMPEYQFNALYKCIPFRAAVKCFDVKDIEECIKPLSNKPALVAGIDIGRSGARGGDLTVITMLDEDCHVCGCHAFKGLPHPAQQREIKRLIPDMGMFISWDATGLGESNAEQLIEYGYSNLEPIKFSETTKPRLINRLITEITMHNIGFPEDYRVELTEYERHVTERGKEQFSHPLTGGIHDDYVDSLALAVDAYVRYQNNRSITHTGSVYADEPQTGGYLGG